MAGSQPAFGRFLDVGKVLNFEIAGILHNVVKAFFNAVAVHVPSSRIAQAAGLVTAS